MSTAEYLVEVPWLGDDVQVSACDSVTNWTTGTDWTLSLDTTSEQEGSGCLQATCAGALGDRTVFRNQSLSVGAQGITEADYLRFDLYISDIALLGAFRGITVSSSTTDGTNQYYYYLLNLTLVSGWNYISIALADMVKAGSPNLDSIVRVLANFSSLSAMTIRLDNIRFQKAGTDVTARLRSDPGLSITRGRDQIRQLAPPTIGKADFDLDNTSQDYSPEYSSGPLYGYLIPGKKVKVRGMYSGTTYHLFKGSLDDIPQHPGRGDRSVSLPNLGALSCLKGKKISTALYASKRTDQCLGYIFDAVGWPAADRVFDTGKTTLDWWWLNNEDAFDAAVALYNTEGPGAALYEDGQGRIVFESRHYRLTTSRCTSSQATFRDTGAEPLHSRPFSYNPGLQNIINECTITVKRRVAAGSVSVIWSLGTTVTLAANESRSYVVTSDDPFTEAVSPLVASTDYTVSAGSLSGNVTLNRTSGQNCVVTLTAGSSGATVTGLQVRAKTVTVSNTILVANTVSTSASQANYGLRTYNLSVRSEIPVNTAQDFCNAVVGLYQSPRPIVAITVNNDGSARLTQILTREISDRITIVEAQTGLSADFYIESITHKITYAGKRHLVLLGCEKSDIVDYGIYGTSTYGDCVWGF